MRAKPLTPAQRMLAVELAPAIQHVPTFEPAVVDGVFVNGSYSGTEKLVTVTWRNGTGLPMPYLGSYTPVLGDTVLLLVEGPQSIIMGRIAGAPSGIPVDG